MEGVTFGMPQSYILYGFSFKEQQGYSLIQASFLFFIDLCRISEVTFNFEQFDRANDILPEYFYVV